MAGLHTNRDIAGELRALLVGGLVGVAIVFAIVISFGEFDWRWLLSGLFALVLSAIPLLAMYRWGIPMARRLRYRLDGLEYSPAGEPAEILAAEAKAARVPNWFKRIRVQVALSTIEGIGVCALVGASLGQFFFLLIAGAVLSIMMAVTWILMWTFQRSRLEHNGFRW